ncbi:MAG: phosphotransferase [Bacteroidota bacterium]
MKKLYNRFLQHFPNHFFLSYDIKSLESFLKQKGFLSDKEIISSVEKPGEGNMNFVLRVLTNERTFIIKQARPWVEKYPQIDAPVERNKVESSFYTYVNDVEVLRLHSPKLLFTDHENFISIVSDLGEGSDYLGLYKKSSKLKNAELESLIHYITTLHQLDCKHFPENKAMRLLNHEHIFNFPFKQDNQFDLDAIQTGLQALALPFQSDKSLKKEIERLGDIYLSKGNTLIHGDYYPGSWLKGDTSIKVIDPEFSFLGYAEFDVGVMLAHMRLTDHDKQIFKKIFELYQPSANFNSELVAGFAGTEILRRLMGVAQLPVSFSLEEKRKIMEEARKWIATGVLE